MMELILAIIGGAVCGAIGVGCTVVGFMWWQNQQRIQQLKANLNRMPPVPSQASQPLRPIPVTSYYSAPNATPVTEYPTDMPPVGVTPGAAWLDGVGGIVKGQRMMISKDETLMGRSGVCDLQFHDPKVSRQHAVVRRHQNDFYVQDMQSSRGTFVNGQRINNALLHDRDQIQMGDTIVVFRRM